MRRNRPARILAALALASSLDGAAALAQDEPIHGAPSTFKAPAEETLSVEAGARLYAEPAPDAPAIGRIDVLSELRVFKRVDGWVRVRFDGRMGWIDTAGVAAPGLGENADASRWLPPAPPESPAVVEEPRGADPRRLAEAVEALGVEHAQLRLLRPKLGPFDFHTNLDDPALLDGLAAIAEQLPKVFTRRYGVELGALDGQAVVLFSRQRDYRAYADADPELAPLESWGHAGHGLAVLSLREHSLSQARALFIHETAHLLARRAFGPDLPPWLDEGLAEELSYSQIERDGTVDPSRLVRSRQLIARDARRSAVLEETGPFVRLRFLLKRWDVADGIPIPLAKLLGAERGDFLAPDQRPTTYPLAAFWIRYLLSDATTAEAFRGYLQDLADGGPSDGEALRERLDRDWESLERGYGAWLNQLTFR